MPGSSILLNLNSEAFDRCSPLMKVRQRVMDQPSEKLTVAQAAGIASMHETHFATYFRNKTNVTFKTWMDAVRVERAMVMLRTSDRSITEIAEATGFNDTTTFSRTFNRLLSQTPSQYRKKSAPFPSDLKRRH